MDKNLVTDTFVIETAWRRWGIQLTRKGHEFHGACPNPGCSSDRDGFWITELGHYQCRNCDIKGWLDDDRITGKIDPLELIRRAEDRARVKKEREEHYAAWLNGFKAGYYWRQWHDKMTSVNRAWWYSQGISDRQIDYYELGYTPEKVIKTESGNIIVSAYTIPTRDPLTWEVNGLHYRLESPPEGVGKYRSNDGIAQPFYSVLGKNDKAILVEGGKKAIVTYDRIDGDTQVIGLPSCNPSQELLETLKDIRNLWLCLDPGCERQAIRIRSILPQVRIVNLPGKPDDLFLSGMEKNQFREFCRQAR